MPDFGILVLRDEEMPIDYCVIDKFICMSFSYAKKMAEEDSKGVILVG